MVFPNRGSIIAVFLPPSLILTLRLEQNVKVLNANIILTGKIIFSLKLEKLITSLHS